MFGVILVVYALKLRFVSLEIQKDRRSLIQNDWETDHVESEVEHQRLEVEGAGHVVEVVLLVLLLHPDDRDLAEDGHEQQGHHGHREIVRGNVLQFVVVHDEEGEQQVRRAQKQDGQGVDFQPGEVLVHEGFGLFVLLLLLGLLILIKLVHVTFQIVLGLSGGGLTSFPYVFVGVLPIIWVFEILRKLFLVVLVIIIIVVFLTTFPCLTLLLPS